MDFVTYLEGLPPGVVADLYSSPWTCRAVLRGVPPLAKHYIMRLLLVDDFISESKARACPVLF